MRSILHVDMDAFFVSVELLRRPDLAGQPVVVGGTGGRGVVAAASYEARRWGVHSAMSSAQARRLCPSAVFLPPDMAAYSRVSRRLHEIFCRFTPLVEQISVDEAFLDVTGARRLLGAPEEVAAEIRRVVRDETGLGCSVGIATNKFIAKMASEFAKPVATRDGVREGTGVHVVAAGTEREFLAPLPVRSLWGVGPATRARLESIGVSSIGDIALVGEDVLIASLGRSHGTHLHRLALGLDERAVTPEREAKSIGHEETFPRDVTTHEEARAHLVRLCEAVARRTRAAGLGAGTLMLKVKYSTFETVTRSVTPSVPLTTGPSMVAALEPLLAALDVSVGVRLLGVHAQRLGQGVAPASLFGPDDEGPAGMEELWQPASRAMDSITERFGPGAISPASALGARSAPGENPYGPDADHGAAAGAGDTPPARGGSAGPGDE